MDAIADFKARREALAKRLQEEAPFVVTDQKHTTSGTPEWAYWHFGYCVALADVIKRMTEEPIK